MKHKTYCWKLIKDENENVMIACGDDLGGFDGEFAQCSECYEKDSQEQNKQKT